MAVTTASADASVRTECARAAQLLRASALIVDIFVLGAITFIVNSVYGVDQPTSALTIGGGAYSTTVAWPWLTLVAILYFAVPEALFSATPGKAWARLKVVRLDGRPLSVGSVVVRNLLRPIDSLPILYLLGGVFVLFTRGSQRLGDLAGGTTVVFRHRAQDPGATRSASPTARRWLVAAVVLTIMFTVLFDYFGRPQLVIAGMFNTQQAPMSGVTSYTLGQPQWKVGEITYPITLLMTQGATESPGAHAMMNCSGSVTLEWEWPLGWTSGQSGWSCSLP